MIIEGNHIRPGEGYKYVTNGIAWSEDVYLGKFDSAANWYDTNDEPPIHDDGGEATEEERALTRYANELTGENDADLVSATETLIKHFTEE